MSYRAVNACRVKFQSAEPRTLFYRRLAATLLTSGQNRIENIPEVRDVNTMILLLEELGARVDHREDGKILLDTAGSIVTAPYQLVSTMRASCLVLGPLLARLGKAKVSLPGGCAIGARPIDLHLKGLEAMGAKMTLEKGYIFGVAERLKEPAIISTPSPSPAPPIS